MPNSNISNISDSDKITTKWIQYGEMAKLCFVGRDAIFCGIGCHLIFYDLISNSELIYTANDESAGDGVKCYTGHRNIPLFSFAERCYKPKVHIFAYPNFEKIATLSEEVSSYVDIVFSDTDHIIALSGPPCHRLIIWNWRSGDKLGEKNTTFFFEKQLLLCNTIIPIILCQWSTISNTFTVWEINICAQKCTFTPHYIKITNEHALLINMKWSLDNVLYCIDSSCNLYTVNLESNQMELILKYPEVGNTVPSMVWFKGGLVISGTDGNVMHFKRPVSTSHEWTICWCVTPPDTLKTIITCAIRELMLGLSLTGALLRFDISTLQFYQIYKYYTGIIDMCVVDQYVVTLNIRQKLKIWNILDGEILGTIQLEHQPLSIVANPIYPYVAYGLNTGVLVFVSICNPAKPNCIYDVCLMSNSIDIVYFSVNGNYGAAANLSNGHFFIIQASPEKEFQVLSYISVHNPVCDCSIIGRNLSIELITINKETSKLWLYTDLLKNENVNENYEKHELFQLVPYISVCSCPSSNGQENLYAIPYLSRQIHYIEIIVKDKAVCIKKIFETSHQIHKLNLSFYANNVLTFDTNGTVIVRTIDKLTIEQIAMITHHQTTGGVIQAFINRKCDHIVSLGRNGDLVCVKLPFALPSASSNSEQESYSHLFKNRQTADDVGNSKGIKTTNGKRQTWLELQEELKILSESIKCAAMRQSIQREFNELKNCLIEAINKNETAPILERLPIDAFNLDLEYKTKHIDLAKEKRKVTKERLELIISAQDKVSSWLIKTFWNSMKIKGTRIWTIFANQFVENYTLLPTDRQLEEDLEQINTNRIFENLVLSDLFQPWIPFTEMDLKEYLAQMPKLILSDETVRLKALAAEMDQEADEDEDEQKEQDDMFEKVDDEYRISFGTTSHRFLDKTKISLRYSQFEVKCFAQKIDEECLRMSIDIDLRKTFNKLFENMMSLKEREVNILLERNVRLRYIISELNWVLGVLKTKKYYNLNIIDPINHMTEKPENICKVDNSEVSVFPYISPSQQAFLDAKAAEEERIRLLLLADDFKERALIEMMDGVLEIRWEDELKKEVPKPKCMLEKKPEEYNEEDLKLVMEYEEKVRFLQSERDRYRAILESEYSKLATTCRNDIEKLNSRISELFSKKLLVDAAIYQEYYRTCRAAWSSYCHKSFIQQEVQLIKDIEENDMMIDKIQSEITYLNEVLAEYRLVYDACLNRDRTLEKNLRKDFPDVSNVIMEQIYKIYKKRPKQQPKAPSPGALIELGHCCVSGQKSLFLTSEGVEFLRSLDFLDQHTTLPNAVSEQGYALFCKLRRIKIESEIKLKSILSEFTEAESTITFFHKRLAVEREKGIHLAESLNNVRAKKLQNAHNFSIQFVLKNGLVEIPTSGSMNDFKDAILISRIEVENINQIILSGGDQKLQAMYHAMNFRRGILTAEWRHKHMRMEIEDLEEQLMTVKNAHVTKDMLEYLRKLAKGTASDKGLATLDREVENIRESYIRMINERQKLVEELDIKIRAKRKDNKILNEKILNLNVDVCERELNRNFVFEEKVAMITEKRIGMYSQRTRLMKLIQEQHNEILILQTELELLRLRTYPTLRYRTLF